MPSGKGFVKLIVFINAGMGILSVCAEFESVRQKAVDEMMQRIKQGVQLRAVTRHQENKSLVCRVDRAECGLTT